jgi:type I restriction enzyme S subunit
MSEVKNVPDLRFAEFSGEWKRQKLGEVSIFYDGKRVPLKDSDRAKRQGKYPYYGASGIIDYIDDFIFDGEYVLLGEDGANIVTRSTKLAFIVKGQFWVNNHAHIMKAKSSNTFLAESLERIRYEIYNTGTAQPKLNAEVCRKIPLYMPCPKEQEKIADFLSSVDKKIEQLTQKHRLLTEYKKGVMQQIFTQQIRFKDDNGNEYPNWEEKRLGELGKLITGKTPSTTNAELWNGLIPFVTPSDMHGGKYQFKTARTVTLPDKNKLLPVGAIMFTSIASIGKMSLSAQECITNQQINSLIVSNRFHNEFIYYALLKLVPKIKSTQANTTLPIINKTEFSKFKLDVPVMEEQQKIANFLTEIDQKIDQAWSILEQTKAFKKGLLQKMFV